MKPGARGHSDAGARTGGWAEQGFTLVTHSILITRGSELRSSGGGIITYLSYQSLILIPKCGEKVSQKIGSSELQTAENQVSPHLSHHLPPS